jgi:outer membrane protein TolC
MFYLQRQIVLSLIALILLLIPVTPTRAQEPTSLDRLIEEALAANPEIETARKRTEAVRQKVPQAGALDDPMLGFGILNLPESLRLDEEDMTTKELSLSQKVPFFGKRDLMRAAAEKEADAAHNDFDEAVNQVVKNVRSAYYELAHTQRAAEVTRRNKAILEDLAKLAQTRYAVGQGIQEDAIRAQVEISRMVDDLLMLEQRRLAQEAKLIQFLNRDPRNPLTVDAELAFQPVAVDIARLQAEAEAHSPMLKALAAEAEAGRAEVSLAQRDRYPDFNFKVAYGQRDDRPDMYSAMVEINLPVFIKSKQNPKIDQAGALLAARRARIVATRNELRYMIADMGSMAQRLEKQIQLYRTGIIPQTQLQIQSALSAYTVNKADFMTLLDSRMRLYRFELDYHQAVTDHAKSVAALEAAIGRPLARGKESP